MVVSDGWAGKVLNVDLTTGEIEKEPLDREWAIKYIGGSCFGARILYDKVGPEVDPLGPDNITVIATGPLNGTLAPSSGRCELVAKSPLTGIFGRSNVGGNFGPEMKFAGYDLIIIRGKSENPVYLWIDDDKVELRDASHLWGQTVWSSRDMLCSENKGSIIDRRNLGNVSTLLIGPAGENLSLAACVMSGRARAAGDGAIGAVWGSKKLKGIAVKSSKGVNVARPDEFLQICKTLWGRYNDDPLYEVQRKWGTIGWVGGSYSRSPAGHLLCEGARNEEIEEAGFAPLIDKPLACHGCPIHCSHFLNVKENNDKYKGTKGEGLEGFVQIFAFSWKTNSAGFLTKYNILCNDLGLNVSTPGPAITWAMNLWEAGIITKADTDGIEITWGNEDAILELTRKIAYREGFGDILADYPLRAAQRLGRGSDKYAAHTKGHQSWGVGPGTGTTLGYTLALNTATRGFDHLTGSPSVYAPDIRDEFGITRELLSKLGEERYNDPEIFLDAWGAKPKKAKVVYDLQNEYAMADITGTCKFVSRYGLIVAGTSMSDFSQLITAVTGEVITTKDLVDTAQREILIERAYNAREGIRRIDDYPFFLWWQLKHGESNPRFDYEKQPVNLENYDIVLDEYYRLLGCDLQTGIPIRKKLEELGLTDIADDLEKRGIIQEAGVKT
ncbi:aldehyde ferredoxin oxidoreductase family protein [Chloroflexota bacterium]